MDPLVLVIAAALIVLVVGGVVATMRYRYTRPNTASVRMIAILTVVLAVLTVGVYALPRVTASPGSNSPLGFGGSPTVAHSPIAGRSPTPTRTPSGSTVIKIGSDLPVSGGDASVGLPIQNAIHLAIDEANANHSIPGYTLMFAPRDDVGPSGVHDPAVGSQNVTALIGDALVAGIVGPFNSSVSKAEMPITNQAPIALISPSNTTPCLTKNTPLSGCTGVNDLVASLRPTGTINYFRIAVTDDNQAIAAANYLFTTLSYRKAYVIDDAESYGIGLANNFIQEWQTNGGSLAGHDSLPSTTTNFSTELAKVAAAKPDVIYFGGIDATGGTAIRQQMLQVQGLQNTPFVGGDGIYTSTFATTIGANNGGPVYSTTAFLDVTKLPQDFISRYQNAYGQQPGTYSAYGYDCANILIQAIKTALANGANTPADSADAAGAPVFRQAVIQALKQISYNGVTGHQSFDANGDTTAKNILVYQLANVNGQPSWKFITTVAVK